MTKYNFACDRCGEQMSVELAEGTDVYSGCNAIRDEHARRSPSCTGDLSTIRLLTSDKGTFALHLNPSVEFGRGGEEQ